MDNQPAASAMKALASKGAKLHTHEAHIRRTDNGKYIVKHDLTDENGKMPNDGQSATAEHSLNNMAELQAHLAKHMPEENMGDNAQAEMDAMAGDKG